LKSFKIGHEYEGIEIINNFTRNARKILNKAEDKWGHKIKLAARTLPTPQKALDCGYDVLTWVQEGLIDLIIPTPRWETTDADIPIEMWKRLLGRYPVEIAVGLEINNKSTRKGKVVQMNVEAINALSAQYLSMGSDKIYLYNYMDTAHPKKKKSSKLFNRGINNSSICKENYHNTLTTIGNLKKVVKSDRKHIVSYPDIGAPWFMDKIENFAPLPLTSKTYKDIKMARVRVGKIPNDSIIKLILGIKMKNEILKPKDIEVYVNSSPITFIGTRKLEPEYTESPLYAFSVKNNGNMPPFLVVEFATHNKVITVDYIEIFISTPRKLQK